MDTIHYPPKEYGSSSIYLLVKPYYLSAQQVQVLTTSVKPPANSSDQTRNELDHLLALQMDRTPQQVKRVEFLGAIGYWPSTELLPNHPEYAQNLKDLFFEGSEILGNTCTADQYPRTATLLKGIMRDMRIMEFTIKYHYNRPRPYHLEPTLKPLTRIGSPSFASGHTLWAFLQAYTWSELLPQRRNEFIKLAEEIRRSREILGIHYPSDNEAARQISHKMLTYYFANKEFLKDFEAASVEWKTYK
ncbi:phosphatase PAP2 family protein [Dyadobacter sp. 50-39]|uniref:phosphatase PAP2 family protein n=1 Tax=Dyadobacter sp. 50-39 TaxID=1895756 RepID=UPI000A545769|nr:phosphatase PAP2 family protein [Dyadobacter sp. 50-39]